MRTQKILVGVLFILIFFGGIFSFFYFSFGEKMINNLTNLASKDLIDNIFSKPNIIENGKERIPVIRENGDSGVLTVRGIIEETNRHREFYFANPLSENHNLNRIAESKLDDMFTNQYFAHVSPSGESVGDIAERKGYKFLLIGDNLAMGNYKDDKDVVRAWMESPGHRQNILEERYQEIGVAAKEGIYREKNVWMAVQVFAMPTSACPEIDPSLELQIEQKRSEMKNLLEKREKVKEEIAAAPRGSELRVQKAEEYNEITREYNELHNQLNNLVNEHNRQIRLKQECIEQ